MYLFNFTTYTKIYLFSAFIKLNIGSPSSSNLKTKPWVFLHFLPRMRNFFLHPFLLMSTPDELLSMLGRCRTTPSVPALLVPSTFFFVWRDLSATTSKYDRKRYALLAFSTFIFAWRDLLTFASKSDGSTNLDCYHRTKIKLHFYWLWLSSIFPCVSGTLLLFSPSLQTNRSCLINFKEGY